MSITQAFTMVNPETLNSVEALRQALQDTHQALLTLAIEKQGLEAATQDVVGMFVGVLRAHMDNKPEEVKGHLDEIVRKLVVTVGNSSPGVAVH